MSWLRLFLMRLFRVPITVTVQTLEIKGEPVTQFTLDHWHGIAKMFLLVPGLEDVLKADMDAALSQLSALPVDSDRERIRLAQKVIDLKGFLDMPKVAVSAINQIYTQQLKDQTHPETKPKGASNLV